MMPKYYTFLLLAALLPATLNTLQAQCTTNAGTLNSPGDILICGQSGFNVTTSGNAVLDSNDILIYVAYTGASPATGVRLAITPDGHFSNVPGFLSASPFKVAAVAGSKVLGDIDWSDPCLSVSAPVTVTYSTNPVVTFTGDSVLTCIVPSTQLSAVADQPGCTFHWSNGSNTPNPNMSMPGDFYVTVTNPQGCSTVAGLTLSQDVNVPIADAGSNKTLTCSTPVVTLNGSGSSSGPNYSYAWFGQGAGGEFTTVLNPVVNSPGLYTLIVTNTQNGCTSFDQVVVSSNPDAPYCDFPTNMVITCTNTSVELIGSCQAGVQYTYDWSGPDITPDKQHLALPSVSLAGVYRVTITNMITQCKAVETMTVSVDVTKPVANAGPDQYVSCSSSAAQLNGTGSSQGPDYVYQWSGPGFINVNTLTPVANQIGTYALTVVDAHNGCTALAFVEVKPPALTGSTIQGISCSGDTNGAITLDGFTGGQAPYTYNWSGPNNFSGTNTAYSNLSPGTYKITITDQTGCSFVYPILIKAVQPLGIAASKTSAGCGSTKELLIGTGGTAPYAFVWNGPLSGNGPSIATSQAGDYTVTVTDAGNCTATKVVTIDVLNNCAFIKGRVISDTIPDCTANNEPGLAGWIVRADGLDTLYAMTDANGRYRIDATLGSYALTVLPPNGLWGLCPNPVTVQLVQPFDTIAAGDLLVQRNFLCPGLTVTLSAYGMHRCFDNGYIVEYENQGTKQANNAYVVVQLDPMLSLVTADVPFTDLGNGKLRVNIGTIPVGATGTFLLDVKVNCDAPIGLAICSEAHIYPDSSCLLPNPQWSGALLGLSSVCDVDSLHFILKNIGYGYMQDSLYFTLIQDYSIISVNTRAPLPAGDSLIISVPAAGSTWRVEAVQIPFAPSNSQPYLSVEGCSNNPFITYGIITQFANGDTDPWLDIDCTVVTSSFDPNDKQGVPTGYGASHYIPPATDIEYTIRFQNTGTDTAFTVVILDTLATWLDPATFRPVASSHNYHADLSGHGILRFDFSHILLPDSSKNEIASHGFVKYSIRPKANTPLETVIKNRAAIYFDFNAPVFTNTTFHRLGNHFMTTAVWQPVKPDIELSIAPNPFDTGTRFELKGLETDAPVRLQVFDLSGKILQEVVSNGAVIHLDRGNLTAGMYFFRIDQGSNPLGSGKIIVK